MANTVEYVREEIQEGQDGRHLHQRPLKIALLGAAMSANTRSWVAGLLQHGHQIEVLTFHPGDVQGATVHAFDMRKLFGKASYLLAIPAIGALLRRLSPDLVIGYYLSSYGLISSLAWNGPLVLTPAGGEINP